jgi:tetratricopeptide (TPR) repeat protein
MGGNANQWDEAQAELIDAVSTRARSLLASGDREQAIATLDRVSGDVTGASALVRAHLAFVAGCFLRGLGQEEAALVRFARSVEADRSNAQYWLGLAGAQLEAGRLSDAFKSVEKALLIVGSDSLWWWLEPQALGLLGRCHLANDDKESAVALLDQFRTRIGEGVPPNPWCDLQLVADLQSRGVALGKCREFLDVVASHAEATEDADLKFRVRPLLGPHHA